MTASKSLFAAFTAIAAVSAYVVPRTTPPAGWWTEGLEDYDSYHTRYLALGCQNQHGKEFFDLCCHPLKADETLETARPPECVPTWSSAMSACLAEPSSTVTTPDDNTSASVTAPLPATSTAAAVSETTSAPADTTPSPVSNVATDSDNGEDDDDETCDSDEEDEDEDEEDDGEDDEEFCDEDGEDDDSSSVVPTSTAAPESTSAPAPSSTPAESNGDDEGDDEDEDCEDDGEDEDDTSSSEPSSTAAPEQTSSPVANAAPSPTSSPSSTFTPEKTQAPSSSKSSSAAESTPTSSSSGEVFSGGVATFFLQNNNAGACGDFHSDNDLIAAIDSRRYGNTGAKSELCGKQVKITNTDNGKEVTVTIADACPTCENENSIDLSTGAFDKIADRNLGVVPISWSFV